MQRETRRVQGCHCRALTPPVRRNSTLFIRPAHTQSFSQVFVLNRTVSADAERPALPTDNGVAGGETPRGIPKLAESAGAPGNGEKSYRSFTRKTDSRIETSSSAFGPQRFGNCLPARL